MRVWLIRRKDDLARYLAVFRFRPYLKKYYPQLTLLVVARLLAVLLGMTLPLFTRYLIDEVLTHPDPSALSRVAVILASVLIASLVLIVFIGYTGTRLDLLVAYALRRTVQRRWERAEVEYFSRWGLGEHIYRATTDVDNVKSVLLKVLPNLVIMILEFIAFFCIAAWLDLRLTLLYMCALPLLAVIVVLYARNIRPVQEDLQRSSSLLNNSLSQYVSGIITTKIFSREKLLSRLYMQQVSDVMRRSMQKWRIETTTQALRWLVSTGWGWFVFFFGFSMVIRGELTIGSLIALRMYLSSLEKPIDELGNLIQTLAIGSVSAERLTKTLTARDEVSCTDVAIVDMPVGAAVVEIENLEFGYRPGQSLLRGLSARFEPGRLIGITGASGVGKTTFVALMARLYNPWNGSIYLDGVNIRDLPLSVVRDAISIVPQESYIFHGTIRDNLAYGNPDASFEEIVTAAQMADAHEFIVCQSAGYDTVLGGIGTSLSLGQRQRIGIARALLKNSRLVIFDEGMNGLDVGSRLRILDSIHSLLSLRTFLLISHDPAILMRCDSVVLLRDGVVAKYGAPEHVCQEGALYDYLVLKGGYERSEKSLLLPGAPPSRERTVGG